jgi:hypothetical protein
LDGINVVDEPHHGRHSLSKVSCEHGSTNATNTNKPRQELPVQVLEYSSISRAH